MRPVGSRDIDTSVIARFCLRRGFFGKNEVFFLTFRKMLLRGPPVQGTAPGMGSQTPVWGLWLWRYGWYLASELVCPMASFECPFPLGVAVEYVSKAGLGSLEFSFNIGKIEFWNYGPYSGVCYGYFVRKNRVRIQRTAIASACLDLSYEQQFICWFGMTIDTLPGGHVGLCWCFPVVVITWCAEGRDVISTVTSLSYGHNYVFCVLKILKTQDQLYLHILRLHREEKGTQTTPSDILTPRQGTIRTAIITNPTPESENPFPELSLEPGDPEATFF